MNADQDKKLMKEQSSSVGRVNTSVRPVCSGFVQQEIETLPP